MYNTLNSLATEIHAENAHWWRDPATGKRIERDKGQTLFLIVSEIVEAGEGERKGLKDDHLPHRAMAEVELADTLIRLFDYIGAHGYDIDGAFRKSQPSLVDKSFNGMASYFAFRYFNRAGNKPKQLLNMIMTVARIAELEDGNSFARDVESQIAWLIALICDYAGIWNYNLDEAVAEKRAYNQQRADHKDTARLAVGGKKW